MNIINLTQHRATPEQVTAGVVDPSQYDRQMVSEWLTFSDLPDGEAITAKARALAEYAELSGYSYALIGGAPYLMSALENELIWRGVVPMYAFSVRESVEQVQPDGSVQKVNTFRHAGFVEI